MRHYLEIGNLISRGAPHLVNNWHIGNFYLSLNLIIVITLVLAIVALFGPGLGVMYLCDKFKLKNYHLQSIIEFSAMAVGFFLTLAVFVANDRIGNPTHKGLNEFNQALTQAHHEYPYYAKVNGKGVYCTANPQLGKKVTFVTVRNDANFAPFAKKYVASHKQEAIAVQLENVRDSKKSLKDRFLGN